MFTTRVIGAACALTAAMLGAGLLSGCAKMSASLGQQWVTVQLAPNTKLAAAQHVTASCSHVSGVHPYHVKPTTAGGIVDSVRFDTTAASDADMARLQRCLQRFAAVQGLTVNEPGN